MNFYNQQILKIRQQHFPKQYLIERLIRAKQFMDTQSSENINLNSISAAASLSKYHFIRLFKKCYGLTPHQYLKEVRIRKAKRLLQSDQTVSGTCYAIGFGSPASFTVLFKKITGFTPSGYQQKEQFSKSLSAGKP